MRLIVIQVSVILAFITLKNFHHSSIKNTFMWNTFLIRDEIWEKMGFDFLIWKI